MRSVLFLFSCLWAIACGGAHAQEAEAEEPRHRELPPSYENARERLAALMERRLTVAQTDDVDTLVDESQRMATEVAEETVAVVRAFQEVIRENGEHWRGRALVGIAAANRTLAILIRNLSYRMPRQVEEQLRILATEDPDAAQQAREEIHASIAEALESRAQPLDHNECVALQGALAAVAERPDPSVDGEALRGRIRELACE
jgi:hypothetical protein